MIDIIGTMYAPVEGDDPVAMPAAVALDGFHVNMTAEAMFDRLARYRVTPTTLRRVFAGDDPADPQWTVALRFRDRTQARRALGVLWPRPAKEIPDT